MKLVLLLAALPLVTTPDGPREAASSWCASCHGKQHQQWAKSRHARSATNRLYRVNHADEPMAWCTTCHAPLGDVSEGVGCASCHLKDGVLLTSRAPTAAGQRAHLEREEPALKTVEACASCHQFNFPIGKLEPVKLSTFPMQNTVEEWKSTESTTTCQACHLPRGSHEMTGGHDLARVRNALEVTARWQSEREVRITLKSRGVAHAMPTGDPFRALRIDLLDERDTVVATRLFGRTIGRAGHSWRISKDLTIPAPTPQTLPQRTLEFEAPPSAISYRVVMVFVGAATASQVGADAEAEVVRGSIAP